MKEIYESQITEAIKNLFIKANLELPCDVKEALFVAEENEPWPLAKEGLGLLKENLKIAKENCLPICQDTGAACVYAEIGNDVHINGDFARAVNEGVRQAYGEGYFRKSIVKDPIKRGNTEDNTPAFITTVLTTGDKLKLTVMPKGFGSENMSRLAMLKPAEGEQGVIDFVIETVKLAGPNPCPPIIVGVGIGGSFDKVTYLAKKALLRPLVETNKDPYYASLEAYLLEEINKLGIGPQGFGGKTTCLGVAIEQMPTHVAGLPVAVNINCHATRRACTEL